MTRRRTLLLAGAGTLGALVVGFGLLPSRSRVGSAALLASPDGVALNGWLRITPDGTVQLAMPRSEMGQGVHTALAMLVAEELDVALDAVQLVPAGQDALYGNVAMFVSGLGWHPREREPGQASIQVRASEWAVAVIAGALGINVTGGSSSVADLFDPLRLAAATARAKLLGSASLDWRLPVAELQCRDGVVSHRSGDRAHFGQLAERAAITPVSDVQPKPPSQWRLVGSAAPRTDLPAKCDGSARFGLDVRQPGQRYAVILHAPAIGGSPGRVDVQAAMALPGVERVVRLPPYAGSQHALAVVGRTTWHALQGAQALVVDWRPRPAGHLSSDAIRSHLEATARQGGGHVFHARGDASEAMAGAARVVEALYRTPYLAHVTLEPINCTARVADGRVDVWVPTQAPGLARAVAARVAGVPEEAVTVHVTYLGGGFGRRLEVDMVGQAVRIAIETGGQPVQLVWPRHEDIGHDFYRPAASAWLRAGFDASGALLALDLHSAGDAVTPRWMERALPFLPSPGELPDKTTAEGLFDLPYDVPHQRMAHTATRSGVPVGYWRAVGHSHNAFFSEGFIDELAHAAGADPLAFRLALLGDRPRHRAVLELAAAQADWGTPLPAGRARGLALHESFGSIVAQVLEVSLDTAGPRVHRVVAAVDCGTVVNPGIVAQQMESGVLFGLAAALTGRVDIVDGVVQQQNLPDLPPLTLAQTPQIETHIVPSTRPPTGMGEPGLPPVAPALANALFALSGQRLRELPLAPVLPAAAAAS
jgi:isoquinoline 1-oxidoreductase beta subunit